MNDFEKLQEKMAAFVKERNWTGFHSPKNLSMSITIESSELMELFQWMDNDEAMEKSMVDQDLRQEIKDEVADIIIYCLSLANVTKIDLKQAIEDKMTRNNTRFPVNSSLK